MIDFKGATGLRQAASDGRFRMAPNLLLMPLEGREFSRLIWRGKERPYSSALTSAH
jgi:hypothetical protein